MRQAAGFVLAIALLSVSSSPTTALSPISRTALQTMLRWGTNATYYHGGKTAGYNSFMGDDPVNKVTRAPSPRTMR